MVLTSYRKKLVHIFESRSNIQMAEDFQKKMRTRSSKNQSPKKDDSLASPNQTDLGNNPDEGFVTTTSSQNANGQFFDVSLSFLIFSWLFFR